MKYLRMASMSPWVVAGYMSLNFFSSVAIIWANKLAYKAGFRFATTLTVIHFIFTFFGLRVMSSDRFRMFSWKRLSILSVVPISLAFCGFVVFNNLSLQFNAIGTYQLLKVMTTPAIVLIQYVCYQTRLPLNQILALVPVCIGVVLATVSSVETNWRGTLFGTAGILSTSVYQIWVKTEQSRLECSSEQLLYYQAPVSAVMLTILLPIVEDVSGLLSFEWVSIQSVWWVLSSSLLAFLVNLSIFLVIGTTSPVSYNVLGHGKLCVILVSGYLIFGDECNARNLTGVSLAVCGIVWYTHLKLARQPVPPVMELKEQENDELIKLTSSEVESK
jgi:solute carrier family 35 protein E3